MTSSVVDLFTVFILIMSLALVGAIAVAGDDTSTFVVYLLNVGPFAAIAAAFAV